MPLIEVDFRSQLSFSRNLPSIYDGDINFYQNISAPLIEHGAAGNSIQHTVVDDFEYQNDVYQSNGFALNEVNDADFFSE